MHKTILIVFVMLLFVSAAAAQKTKFGGRWEQWWDKAASKGIVVELKEKNGRVSGIASGAIPRLYEAEIKAAKIVGNSFTARIIDDWGNSAVVKFTINGKRMAWRVLQSRIKASMTFPLKADLKRTR